MAITHFAQLDENNKIINITHIDVEYTCDADGKIDENIGIQYCMDTIDSSTKWKRIYYNADTMDVGGIGSFYNEELGKFILPQPFPSWSLDMSTGKWNSPIPEPELSEEEKERKANYRWDEEEQKWDLFESDCKRINI